MGGVLSKGEALRWQGGLCGHADRTMAGSTEALPVLSSYSVTCWRSSLDRFTSGPLCCRPRARCELVEGTGLGSPQWLAPVRAPIQAAGHQKVKEEIHRPTPFLTDDITRLTFLQSLIASSNFKIAFKNCSCSHC